MINEFSYHKPVLTREVLTYMAPKPGGLYLDVTFGGGGHTRALLEAEPTCRVVALDWDQQALDLNAPALEEEFKERFIPLWGNFAQLPLILKKAHIGKVDGLLADFGTSQYQLTKQPGFSFASNTPLDMRMSTAHQRITAAHILNKSSEEELSYIFFTYGEERHARKIAQAIVEIRRKKPIKTTGQLVELVSNVVRYKPFSRTGQKINPATKVFQALRIAVNHELDNIKAILRHSLDVLNDGGHLVCISFHSLEDRIVKQFMRDHQQEFELLTPSVVTAQPDEKAQNSSSRSARLRAAEFKTK